MMIEIKVKRTRRKRREREGGRKSGREGGVL